MKRYESMENTLTPHPELPLKYTMPKFFVMLCKDSSGNAYEVRYYSEDVLEELLQKIKGATRAMQEMFANAQHTNVGGADPDV